MPQSNKPSMPEMPRQRTDRPGRSGAPDGPAHHEPLSRDAAAQKHYGPGTYGNDQFAAVHYESVEAEVPHPEGLEREQPQPERPTTRPKDRRYGRIGENGTG